MQTASFAEGRELMSRSRRSAPALMMFVGVLAFVLAACSGDDAEPASTEPAVADTVAVGRGSLIPIGAPAP